MRQITRLAAEAFLQGKEFKSGNTAVSVNGDEVSLLLHGNEIAHKGAEGLRINLCGWNTKTTRERLNGLPGISITVKKGQAFLNGEPIPDIGYVTVNQL